LQSHPSADLAVTSLVRSRAVWFSYLPTYLPDRAGDQRARPTATPGL